MKITERINQLTVNEVLKTGTVGNQIIFEKLQSSIDAKINLFIGLLNTSIIINDVENGIDDNQLEQALIELKEKHLEQTEMCFSEINRHDCDGKFDI